MFSHDECVCVEDSEILHDACLIIPGPLSSKALICPSVLDAGSGLCGFDYDYDYWHCSALIRHIWSSHVTQLNHLLTTFHSLYFCFTATLENGAKQHTFLCISPMTIIIYTTNENSPGNHFTLKQLWSLYKKAVQCYLFIF